MNDNGAAARFRLAPEIISETFDDGESVVVNLENGFYFSLNPVGGLMFALIGSGATVAEVVIAVTACYEADTATVHEAVAAFATRLVEEALVVAGVPETAAAPAAPSANDAASARAQFEAPTLTAYTDMQDLLLADPVHDYDETGWPVRVDES